MYTSASEVRIFPDIFYYRTQQHGIKSRVMGLTSAV